MEKMMNDNVRERGKKYLETEFNSRIGRGLMKFQVLSKPRWLVSDCSVSNDPFDTTFETVESVDISMRPADFERLTSLMGWYSVSSGDYSGYSRYVEQTLALERKIRKEYPAVQKAYEKYQTLLKMVNDGKEIQE